MQEPQLNVEGLPPPVARAIEVVVQLAHRLAGQRQGSSNQPVAELPRWEGTVKGTLNRKELYDGP